MDLPAYVDFVIKLIADARARKRFFIVLKYLIAIALVTPVINTFLEQFQTFRLVKNLPLSFKYLPYGLEALIIMIWVVFWLLTVFLINHIPNFSIVIWQFLNRFIIKHKYQVSFNNWPKEWIIQGGVRLDVDKKKAIQSTSLVVALSNSGCLLKGDFWHFPTVWKNFEMKFDLFLPSEEGRAIGIIFRAKDLENYFMLQIRAWKAEDYIVLIKPHVRLYGNWEVIDLQIEDLLNNMKFESTTASLRIKIVVRDLCASVFVNETPIYYWSIPSSTEPNLIQHEDYSVKAGLVVLIPFRNSYGMVGFRAYPGEKAFVRNLTLRSI